jgi:hypothetical protein
MFIVPVAEGTGFEQPVFFRFMQVNSSAAAGECTVLVFRHKFTLEDANEFKAFAPPVEALPWV